MIRMSNPVTGRPYFSTKFTNLSVIPNCDLSENGSLEVSGNIYTNVISKFNTSSGGVYLENTLFNSGNVGVTGGLTVNGNITSTGLLYLLNTADSVSLTEGPNIIFGGLSVAKTLRSNIVVSPFVTANNLLTTNLTTTNLNVNIGRFSFVSTTTLFSNFATVGNFFASSNTIGTLRISGTALSSSTSVGSLIVSGGLSIQSTQTGTSSSSGNSITVAGGIGVIKDAYIGNSLFVSNIDMTPSTGDLFRERTLALSNGTGPQNITNFSFGTSTSRYFTAWIGVKVTVTGNELFSGYSIQGVRSNLQGWIIQSNFIGDKIDIKFTITSAGQMQYTTGMVANWISGSIQWRALTINV